MIRKNNLSFHLINTLGLRIVGGTIAEGETLPIEGELAAEFDVSRTVVREAIRVLVDKGLIEVRPKIGTRALPRRHWKLLDADVLQWQCEAGPTHAFLCRVVEIRRSIEVLAAELAAVRATDDDLAAIVTAYNNLEAVIDDDDAYIDVDLNFHETIYRACHNELLEQIAITLRHALRSSRKITVQVPGASRKALAIHRAVVEAIARRDCDAARDATNQLIDISVTDINRILRQPDDQECP